MNTLHQTLKLFCILLLLLTQSSFGTSKPKAIGSKKPDPPTIYAFIVGVESYRSGFLPLNYAKDDAYYLQQYLTSHEGMALPDRNVKVLTDDKAKKNEIIAALHQHCALASENDLFIFYFSGHGLSGCFVPYDNEGENKNSMLKHTDITYILELCKAKNKLILADACFSEGSAKGSLSELQKKYYKEMLDSKGTLCMMSSSKGDEMSFEGTKHGFFTEYLVKGMKGAADKDNDKIVSLKELYLYVSYNVREGTNFNQNPMISDGYDEYMPIVYIRKGIVDNNEADKAAWKAAKQKNTETAYNQYLANYPEGLFEEEAKEKIEALQVNTKPKNANFTETHDGLNLDMVFVQGGSFKMGSNNGGDDEKPVHSVTLSDFYIGKTEVTQRQWYAIMGTNPSHFKNCDDCPVEKVSWDEVQEFLKKLNEIIPPSGGKGAYRLPTEAEWEYAARGGNKSKGYTYSGGNTLENVAWYGKNSNSKTHSVGGKSSNELGIYDMSGNVWEWCQDVWHSNYKDSPNDGSAWVSGGNASYRVLRGGSWINYNDYCRVSIRYGYPPSYRYHDYGFRFCLGTNP